MSDENELQSEFRPPDIQMVDFMMGLANEVDAIFGIEGLTTTQKDTLEAASRSIKILLAMAISGHQLFMAEGKRLDDIADVARTLYDMLFLIEPSALENVRNLHLLTEYSRWEDSVEGEQARESRDSIRNLFWTD